VRSAPLRSTNSTWKVGNACEFRISGKAGESWEGPISRCYLSFRYSRRLVIFSAAFSVRSVWVIAILQQFFFRVPLATSRLSYQVQLGEKRIWKAERRQVVHLYFFPRCTAVKNGHHWYENLVQPGVQSISRNLPVFSMKFNFIFVNYPVISVVKIS